MNNKILEIPLDSVQSALAAQEAGATRVELCADLENGGTTPSAGMIAAVRAILHIKLHIMIRPRAGDFYYSGEEIEVMKRDIVTAKQFRADGVVFGILSTNNSVEIERMKPLVSLARPMSVTFHRAFDLVTEPLKALEDIINLGIERILTSGQQATAMEGIALIKKLVDASSGMIIIMPAAGINSGNVQRLIQETGVREIHVGSSVSDKIEYLDSGIYNARRLIVNKEKVETLIKAILPG